MAACTNVCEIMKSIGLSGAHGSGQLGAFWNFIIYDGGVSGPQAGTALAWLLAWKQVKAMG
jgi:hypothetical protein